jgi:hypothetical protein
VLETRKELSANTLQEFIAILKADAKKMQYGSAGAAATTHLACSLLNAKIGVSVTHVPYRGSAPAANGLIRGQIDYLCGNFGSPRPSALRPTTVSTGARSRAEGFTTGLGLCETTQDGGIPSPKKWRANDIARVLETSRLADLPHSCPNP